MKKVVSCCLSFVPAVMIAITFVVLLLAMMFLDEGPMSTGEVILMFGLFLFELIGVVMTFVMMIWYMIKTFKNPEFSTGIKVLWCALLYCFNMFIFPVYWFMYVRKEE